MSLMNRIMSFLQPSSSSDSPLAGKSQEELQPSNIVNLPPPQSAGSGATVPNDRTPWHWNTANSSPAEAARMEEHRVASNNGIGARTPDDGPAHAAEVIESMRRNGIPGV